MNHSRTSAINFLILQQNVSNVKNVSSACSKTDKFAIRSDLCIKTINKEDKNTQNLDCSLTIFQRKPSNSTSKPKMHRPIIVLFFTTCLYLSFCNAGLLTNMHLPSAHLHRPSPQMTCNNSTFMMCLKTYVTSFGVTEMPANVMDFIKIYVAYLHKYGTGGFENSCKFVNVVPQLSFLPLFPIPDSGQPSSRAWDRTIWTGVWMRHILQVLGGIRLMRMKWLSSLQGSRMSARRGRVEVFWLFWLLLLILNIIIIFVIWVIIKNWDCIRKAEPVVDPAINACEKTFETQMTPWPGADKACQWVKKLIVE